MTTPPADKGMLLYLALTALICGASIMIIEVLGSRVVGPFFGVSLFVWTSLITVTLLALAGGYAMGGVIADRSESADVLYFIILASGVLTLLIPAIKAPVLKACMSLGLRAGSFTSTLLLFGPALFSLGCVSPFIIRLATREVSRVGRTVGGFYALSTIGSVIGTALTGFVLIAYMGTDRIFTLLAFLLFALAAGYFILFRRRWLATASLLLPLIFFPADNAPVAQTMANGTRVEQIDAVESHYGSIKVVDYRYGNAWTRELIIDGLVQGGISPRTGLSVYEYAYFMTHLPYALNPQGKRALVIGLGAGVVPRWFDERHISSDIVEIDPAVVDVAREHFGFTPSGEVHLADARHFLSRPGSSYDYIVLDVFNGDITPGYLLSREAMQLIEPRLNPGGVLVMNLVGSLTHRNFMTASVVKTIAGVFDQVRIHPTFNPAVGDGMGNLAIVAYNGAPRAYRKELLQSAPVHPLAAKGVTENLWDPFQLKPERSGITLRDDYNPIDFHDAWLREKVRKQILKTTNWSLLLGAATTGVIRDVENA